MVLEHHGTVGTGIVDLAVLEQHAAAAGFAKPATIFKSVDLPQPEWPMMETYWPLSTSTVMSCKTSVSFEPRVNVLST